MTTEKFSIEITVPASAIDERNHVNNLSYLEWCLQAAETHWRIKASEEIREQYVWYVLKHEIEYKSSAFEGEVLEVVTWVTSAEGVRSERRYEIFRKADGKKLVRARTQWCLLNGKTLKPTKIPEEIRNLF
ncbi:MAG: acyl-CoA thioesterase [Flavobacteriaceae bacterium]|nr:acyl-CoA thioesterase [Flavobacteriaceae bacterium]